MSSVFLSPVHLRAARNACKLTISALAEATGVGFNTISRIENEEVLPREQTMVKLQAYFEGRGFTISPNGISWDAAADLPVPSALS